MAIWDTIWDMFLGDKEETTTTSASVPRFGKWKDMAQALQFSLSVRNADLAEKNYKRFNEVFQPYEDNVVAANNALIGPSMDLNMASIRNQKKLLGPTTDFTLANVQAQTELLPFRTQEAKDVFGFQKQHRNFVTQQMGFAGEQMGFQREQMAAKSADLSASRGISNKFFQQSLEGIDPERRAGQAVAEVEGAFKGAESELRGRFGAFGIDPSSGSFQDAIRKVTMDKARARSGAVTSARERAETESFARLGAAMGVRDKLTTQTNVPVPGANIRAPGQGISGLSETSFNTPLQNVSTPSGPSVSDPTGRGIQQGALAGAGLPGLSQSESTESTQTSKKKGGGDGIQVGVNL